MKVFGIGLSRTGTKSLTRALELLGYRAVHSPRVLLRLNPWAHPILRFTEKVFFSSESFHYPRFLYWGSRLKIHYRQMREYDAATDTPVARFYKKLDRLYPDSRFILTERDMESWLNSCEAFFKQTKFSMMRKMTLLHYSLYGTNCYDRRKFCRAYERHVGDVLSYFGRKPDRLCASTSAAGRDGRSSARFWVKICPGSPFRGWTGNASKR